METNFGVDLICTVRSCTFSLNVRMLFEVATASQFTFRNEIPSSWSALHLRHYRPLFRSVCINICTWWRTEVYFTASTRIGRFFFLILRSCGFDASLPHVSRVWACPFICHFYAMCSLPLAVLDGGNRSVTSSASVCLLDWGLDSARFCSHLQLNLHVTRWIFIWTEVFW